MPRYKATKDGWDGRRIVKRGEIFNFDGPRGSWMVPVDGAGNVIGGVPDQRPLRAGAKMPTSHGREALREKCRELGINFKATMGAEGLAELIRQHAEGSEVVSGESEDLPAREVEPGEGRSGTGNADVL